MSANKMGSKLAQGVRQIMEQQGKNPEQEKTEAVTRQAPAAPVASVSKPAVARSTSKAQVDDRMDDHEVLHPSRVWPD